MILWTFRKFPPVSYDTGESDLSNNSAKLINSEIQIFLFFNKQNWGVTISWQWPFKNKMYTTSSVTCIYISYLMNIWCSDLVYFWIKEWTVLVKLWIMVWTFGNPNCWRELGLPMLVFPPNFPHFLSSARSFSGLSPPLPSFSQVPVVLVVFPLHFPHFLFSNRSFSSDHGDLSRAGSKKKKCYIWLSD